MKSAFALLFMTVASVTARLSTPSTLAGAVSTTSTPTSSADLSPATCLSGTATTGEPPLTFIPLPAPTVQGKIHDLCSSIGDPKSPNLDRDQQPCQVNNGLLLSSDTDKCPSEPYYSHALLFNEAKQAVEWSISLEQGNSIWLDTDMCNAAFTSLLNGCPGLPGTDHAAFNTFAGSITLGDHQGGVANFTIGQQRCEYGWEFDGLPRPKPWDRLQDPNKCA